MIWASPISADATVTLKLRSADAVLIERVFTADSLVEDTLTIPLPESVTSAVELEVNATGHVVLRGISLEWDS